MDDQNPEEQIKKHPDEIKKQWENLQNELQKIQEIVFPERYKIDGEVVKFNVKGAAQMFVNKDKFNLPTLIDDGLIQPTNSPISLQFQECELGYWDGAGIFVGQHQDGDPNGYIRFIDKYGRIYEGVANARGFNGWGRQISDRYNKIGWWY